MAMEYQMGALTELLKEMQSRMDQHHNSLMKTLEANSTTASSSRTVASSSAPSPPSPPAATASILAASSDECETEVTNSTSTGYNSDNTVLSHLAPIREAASPRDPAPVALSNLREKIHCRLVGKERSGDVHLFSFSLPLSDQVLGLCIGKHIFVGPNPTTSNLVTAASTSPTSSATSAPNQDANLSFMTGITELLATSPTRCSTLAPCQAACILAPSLAPSTAFPATTLPQEVVLAIPIVATMTATIDSSLGIDKGYESCITSESYFGSYSLQVGCAAPRHKAADHAKLSHDDVREADKILQNSNDIRNGRGCRQPKPPWLLCRDGSGSWFGEMQLSCRSYSKHHHGAAGMCCWCNTEHHGHHHLLRSLG